MAERLARLVIHANRYLAVGEFGDCLQAGMLFWAQRPHDFLAPIDQEPHVGPAQRYLVQRRMITLGP